MGRRGMASGIALLRLRRLGGLRVGAGASLAALPDPESMGYVGAESVCEGTLPDTVPFFGSREEVRVVRIARIMTNGDVK